jgi:hypothetical protein
MLKPFLPLNAHHEKLLGDGLSLLFLTCTIYSLVVSWGFLHCVGLTITSVWFTAIPVSFSVLFFVCGLLGTLWRQSFETMPTLPEYLEHLGQDVLAGAQLVLFYGLVFAMGAVLLDLLGSSLFLKATLVLMASPYLLLTPYYCRQEKHLYGLLNALIDCWIAVTPQYFTIWLRLSCMLAIVCLSYPLVGMFRMLQFQGPWGLFFQVAYSLKNLAPPLEKFSPRTQSNNVVQPVKQFTNAAYQHQKIAPPKSKGLV